MKFRQLSRALLALSLAIVVLVLGWAAGLLIQGEWQARQAVASPLPPAIAIDTSTGADDRRPVLILLHGAGLNGHMWEPVIRGIDPRIRVIALDMPGHGTRVDDRYTLDAAAEAVAATARQVAPAKVVVAGDSLGGYTSMAAGTRIPPQQLAGLVLSGSSSNFGNRQLWDYASTLVMVRTVALFADPREWAAKAVAAFGVPEADRRAVVDAGITFSAVPQAMRNLLYVDFIPQLAAVDVPVLIANGALDAKQVAGEDRFAAAAKQASRYRFQDTEHGVSLRRSAEFAAMLDGFCKRVLLGEGSPALAGDTAQVVASERADPDANAKQESP